MGSKKRSTIKPSSPRSSKNSSSAGTPGGLELDASLQDEARRRYLSYALSVITSRALPDVRDGLKPVQRRILYAMAHDEHLYPDAKHRKSAKVVGAVIGRYHPHGDTAVYDAMVRMAQDFSLRTPLVDGSGNFGSLDGDRAAAYRYTEARLAPIAMELLSELKQDTVPFRANFDATATEPVVLPARFPNLLVNGSTGIAVGMATNIPPHNLVEISKALCALIDNRTLTTTNLLKYIQGPDFPTGGELLNSKVELRQIYDSGQGALKTRARYKIESRDRGTNVIITSIPYGPSKSAVIERIAEVIVKRKLPQLLDVRDESTTDVRIVLELKNTADPAMVMAYLYKHTPLQLNFNVNLTCLLPTDNPEIGEPKRVGIKTLLEQFIDFRFDVTKKRFEFELAALHKRIHILEGFITVFDVLDETIRIIRRSDGKSDAAQKLIARFGLDAIQVDAILELKLYKLAKLEILVLREELTVKQKEARRITGILRSTKKLWGVVKTELQEISTQYGTPRRTKIGTATTEVAFDADAYILEEDTHVVVTQAGWVKRQREIKDPSSLRVREGDAVMAILPGSTKENVVFFTNLGTAYVIKINDVPATSGYGDPAQKWFRFKDGERIVSAMTLDPRALVPDSLFALSAKGYGMQFSIDAYRDVTTKAGRKYARVQQGDSMIGVIGVGEKDIIVAATHRGHVLVCKADQISRLEGPGRGVTVIKTADNDHVIGFIAGSHKRDALIVQTKSGRRFQLYADPKNAKSRGGKGHQIVKRSTLSLVPVAPTVTPLATASGSDGVH